MSLLTSACLNKMFGKKSPSVLFICFYFLLLKDSCVVSSDIECVPLNDCPFATNLIKNKPYHSDAIRFLKFSHCGFDGKKPKIWCPLFEKSCTTPDSKRGVCKNIEECETFQDYMANVDTENPIVQKYLKSYKCDGLDSEIKVCCSGAKIPTDITSEIHERFLTNISESNFEKCGKQSIENKIIGGVEAYIGEHPWLALLKYVKNDKIKYACAGTLIGEKFVLTAAHCVDPSIIKERNLGELKTVILGEHDLRNKTDCIYQKYGEDCADSPQEFKVSDYIMHPRYDKALMINDIAIIRLDRKAIYSDFVQPICLPPADFKLLGNESFVISGWGQTEREKQSNVKRKATLKFSNVTVCNAYNGRNLTEHQICAGVGKGIDSCYGDSGGPLMMDMKIGKEFATFVIGVVSYGYGQICGAFPSVYTYLPSYTTWLQDTMR